MSGEFENDLRKFSDIANSINSHVANNIATIPESVFVSRLLPIMKEWVVEKKGDNIYLWGIAAGGISNPMIVTTSDGYFMVPPPYNHVRNIDATDRSEIAKIHGLSQLIRTREMNGETREAMKLSNELGKILEVDENVSTHAMYTVQLAKIWKRYNLPLEQVLADIDLDLDLYDEHGRYKKNERVSESKNDESGEDEFEW